MALFGTSDPRAPPPLLGFSPTSFPQQSMGASSSSSIADPDKFVRDALHKNAGDTGLAKAVVFSKVKS